MKRIKRGIESGGICVLGFGGRKLRWRARRLKGKRGGVFKDEKEDKIKMEE